jgi:hypothetical protein
MALGNNRPQPYVPNTISITTSTGLPIPPYFQTARTNVEATLASQRAAIENEVSNLEAMMRASSASLSAPPAPSSPAAPNNFLEVQHPTTGQLIPIGGEEFNRLIAEGFVYENGLLTKGELSVPEGLSPFRLRDATLPKTVRNPASGRFIHVNGDTFNKLIEQGYVYDSKNNVLVDEYQGSAKSTPAPK